MNNTVQAAEILNVNVQCDILYHRTPAALNWSEVKCKDGWVDTWMDGEMDG